MSITKHQKKILKQIRFEGFTLKFLQSRASRHWWITKDLVGDYVHSIDVLNSTAENLLREKLIELDRTDEYRHKYYKLTDKADAILT